MFIFGAGSPSSAYSIARSLRFNSADSAYLNRTPGGAGNQKTFTLSTWAKRGVLGSSQYIWSAGTASTSYTALYFDSSDKLNLIRVVSSATDAQKVTTQVFRDPAAWYHIVVAMDAANTTLTLYVNGSAISTLDTNDNPSNTNGQENAAVLHEIGRRSYTPSGTYFDGYLADFIFVDGTALTPSTFGQTDATTGQWVPKQASGVTYGTNGFWLSFYDNTSTTTLGRDDAGGLAGSAAGSNDWTLNNFSVTAGVGNDSLTDTPTNNYATLNSLRPKDALMTLSNGNLTLTLGAADGMASSTMGMSSGKWYCEFKVASGTGYAGIENGASNLATIPAFTFGGKHYVYLNTGNKGVNDVSTSYGASFTTNTIGVALDLTVPSITFYKDNASQGAITITDVGETWHFTFGSGGGTTTADVNFGQRPFTYTPPADHLALCTSNLPTPTIVKPSAQFDVETYTGTGATRSKTGLGFQPDLVWFKGRSGVTDHALYDAVRGVQKQIESNTTTAETTETTGLTAFNSDGYTTGALAQLNTNAATYAAWLWKKGVTPGFDIVGYTGTGSARTESHSLGVSPGFIIVKCRSSAGFSWGVYHKSLAATEYVLINSTAAKATGAMWNNTAPTSSVFSLGASTWGVNESGATHIAYLFAEVAGFSRFGSYTGTGAADGPFVHCGFRPRFVMVKRTDSTGDWYIWDTARDTYNASLAELLANSTATEAGTADIDTLSNGFKLRATTAAFNASGGTFVFAAFSEAAFKYANAR